MKPSPEKIIEAFDVCLVYVYGYRDARDNPHKTDMETATKWIEAGLSVEVACFVFFDRMNWMHEKHLRFHSKSDRTNIPTCLKIFDQNIEAAIRRAKGEHFDDKFAVPVDGDVFFVQIICRKILQNSEKTAIFCYVI